MKVRHAMELLATLEPDATLVVLVERSKASARPVKIDAIRQVGVGCAAVVQIDPEDPLKLAYAEQESSAHPQGGAR